MSLVVLLGGARSGKSRLALELAGTTGADVTFVATAEALDEEMVDRIAAHRADRPSGWRTVEEPLDLARALASVDDEATCVVDCLSLWVSNLMLRGDDAAAVESAAVTCAEAAAARRRALTIAVTNEVGLGVVPATPLGRAYRDVLGTVNRIWVEACDRAAFVVAGRLLPLEATTAFLPGGKV
ncbi:MAG TPA: bifunctional adenosylcobinamide kinase/adenosylcobinamide-phosphate guanylyltransferase [Gaiella sp.]|jgi:adenosyl cobinamide kinase/adenosyl cobinamide phosphate guanylyltransferase|nr:bifunctional adenosylcobinamide kinase/adenosylcobinamide-phosphate guanylyltransferase [Gaiella sp.]